ncbi:MAG: hypothetical protein CMB47_04155 [Euryarchaeota archaeon]|nr:hypothetical protein [Euryarchaeota archaeon]|tara:strand:+ start:1675 stop:2055 length:381 start_codon:yes stop_codon:yes gene_type:complete
MAKLYSQNHNSVVFTTVLIFIVLIPTPAQGLCIGPEACGILGATFLSMVTIPICLIAFLLVFWPKTRRLLQGLAILPGFMAILTGYLMVIRVNRFDLFYVPLIHICLMIAMIIVGRLSFKKSEPQV